jgi:integrating conjugative element relaxase (TIGR03760 family)
MVRLTAMAALCLQGQKANGQNGLQKGKGMVPMGKALPENGQKAEKAKGPAGRNTLGIHMLSLFQRKHTAPFKSASPTSTSDSSQGLMRPQPATSLLAVPRRQKLLEHIWQRTSVSRHQFAALYLMPVQRYAELVQQFPASESHHHAYPGGMLDHGLEIVAYALKLRQAHLLPAGATPEMQAAQAEAWTAGVAYAALLHDIGKIAVDLHVEHADGSIWHPWYGPLQQPYRFRYRQEREYRLHSAATGLVYAQLLDRGILDWLSGYRELWTALLYVLAGQYEHAGALGELVVRADQASVAQELGGDPAKAMVAPRHALQRKLLDGLRHLLKTEFKLNQAGPSDGWLTQEALWLVSKTASDKLRAHLLAQGIDGIPSSNTAIFNVLQDHGIAQVTSEGKAIWTARVTSDAGWSHSFTFLKLAPSLIWEHDERPAPFAGTVCIEHDSVSASANDKAGVQAAFPDRSEISDSSMPPQAIATFAAESVKGHGDFLLELLQTAEYELPVTAVQATPSINPLSTNAAASPHLHNASDRAEPDKNHGEFLGEHFLAWLKLGIQSRRLVINDARALIHTVADTAYLVSPGVFQRYAKEHPHVATLAKQDKAGDWQWVQKRFEKLQLHRKQNNGLNIWTCEVTGPRKSRRLHGYLLQDPRRLFEDPPPNNPYLSIAAPQSQ